MKSIKFANGTQLEIIECYNDGTRYIEGAVRVCRRIVLDKAVIGADRLEALLADKSNLEHIQVYMNEDREVDGVLQHFEDTELLEGYVFATDGRTDFRTERSFVLGQRTALEVENEEAKRAIDELLIAMEV